VKIRGDRWSSYHLPGPVHVRYDVEAAAEEAHQGCETMVRVVYQMKAQEQGPDQLPGESGRSALEKVETDLISRLESAGVACRWVGALASVGWMELVFQVESAEPFRTCAEAWGATLERTYSVGGEEPGWGYFDSSVRPQVGATERLLDEKTLEALKDVGSDPAKPHLREHYFIGKASNLQVLRTRLEAEGFKFESLEDDMLIVAKPSSIDASAVRDQTSHLNALAREFNVEYDGWGAGVEC